MGRPRKKRPISVTVSWAESARAWQGWVPIKDASGKTIKRIKRSCAIEGEEGRQRCEDLIRELEDELAQEAARRAANLPSGSAKTVRLHTWLRHWLELVKPEVEYKTWRDYRYTVEKIIIPNIDDIELLDLLSDHIDDFKKRARATGSADKPWRGFTYLKLALRAAAARPRETGLWVNPIEGVKAPKRVLEEVEPPSVEQVKAIMEAARQRRNSARWTVCSALGLRPGEALALLRDDFWIVDNESRTRVPYEQWTAIDFLNEPGRFVGYLRVKENLYRRTWEHGCADPHNCNNGIYHRWPVEPCPGDGPKHDRYHRKGCPPPAKRFCQPGCTEHARKCKQRHGGLGNDGRPMPGGQVRKEPKSRAGKRTVRLHTQMTVALINQCAEQDAERDKAGDMWRNTGALFANVIGGLIGEHDDWEDSHAILVEAGLLESRPYDMRHGAATILLLKKVDKRLVMEALGWSSESMLRRYQHVVDEMRGEVAGAIGDALYDEKPYPEPGFPSEPATDLATGDQSGNVVRLSQWRKKKNPGAVASGF